MFELKVRIVTICDKPGNMYCGTWNWFPIQSDNGTRFLKGEFEMKIRKVACLGMALLISPSVALPAIANPENLISIWRAVPSIESDVDADQTSGAETAVTCATGTVDDAANIVHPVAQTSVDCDRVGRQASKANNRGPDRHRISIGPDKLVTTLHREGRETTICDRNTEFTFQSNQTGG